MRLAEERRELAKSSKSDSGQGEEKIGDRWCYAGPARADAVICLLAVMSQGEWRALLWMVSSSGKVLHHQSVPSWTHLARLECSSSGCSCYGDQECTGLRPTWCSLNTAPRLAYLPALHCSSGECSHQTLLTLAGYVPIGKYPKHLKHLSRRQQPSLLSRVLERCQQQ